MKAGTYRSRVLSEGWLQCPSYCWCLQIFQKQQGFRKLVWPGLQITLGACRQFAALEAVPGEG